MQSRLQCRSSIRLYFTAMKAKQAKLKNCESQEQDMVACPHATANNAHRKYLGDFSVLGKSATKSKLGSTHPFLRSLVEDDFPGTYNKVICAMVKSRVLLGMVIPPLIGILLMGI